jgi:hypothetical protein
MEVQPAPCSFFSKPHGFSSYATSWPRVTQRVLILAGIALLTIPGPRSVAGQILDLTQKSLEDLMSIEVTSVSKKEQKSSQAAAAVFVISREDIGHSGALNIPDLMPGNGPLARVVSTASIPTNFWFWLTAVRSTRLSSAASSGTPRIFPSPTLNG